MANVVVEGPGVVSIYLTGHGLDRLAVRAGQYFLWRFLTPDGWWRAHPYSHLGGPERPVAARSPSRTSATAPATSQRLPIGTRVIVEGPYGILTDARRTKPGVALIAGGIGITPLRALLEGLPARAGRLTLLYRARAARRRALPRRARAPGRDGAGSPSTTWSGSAGSPAMPRDPLDARGLMTLVPDLLDRDVYVCGPASMMRAVEVALRSLGVPRRQVHAERFAY